MPSNRYKCPDSSEQDPILKILGKYKDHPSIRLSKAKNNSVIVTSKKPKNLSKVLTRKKLLKKG